MSQIFTGSFTGTFVSTGAPVALPLATGVDYFEVINETIMNLGAGTANGQGVQFMWRPGMAQGLGLQWVRAAATDAMTVLPIVAGNGFFTYDSSVNTPYAPVALTGITNAATPVVNTGSTAGLRANESVVRIYGTVGAQQLRGVDFTVGTVNNASFTLAHMQAIVNANPGAGTYAIVPYNPMFYPPIRTITKMQSHAVLPACPVGCTVVTFSVTHNYVVGQKLTFHMPRITAVAFGMPWLENYTATIVGIGVNDGVGTNTVTVDVDTTGFTFAWPLTADAAATFTPAHVVPAGFNTTTAVASHVDLIANRTRNMAEKGLYLMAGVNSPAGSNGDIITWRATKSYNGV